METASTEWPETLVIQVPAPPSPQEPVAAPAPAPQPSPPQQRHSARDEHLRNAEAAPEPEPADVPTLEPRESSQRETELRDQVANMQNEAERQIAHLSRERMDPANRKTLDAARGFLLQSRRAVRQEDLRRAFNLAQKAQLLVQALEQSE